MLLGGFDRRVPQQQRDGTDVLALLKQCNGKSVAKSVRMYVNTCFGAERIHAAAKRSGHRRKLADAVPKEVPPNWRGRNWIRRNRFECRDGVLWQSGKNPAAGFMLAQSQRSVRKQSGPIQLDRIADAKPRIAERKDHRTHAFPRVIQIAPVCVLDLVNRRKQYVDFFLGKRQRRHCSVVRSFQAFRIIPSHPFSFNAECAKGAQVLHFLAARFGRREFQSGCLETIVVFHSNVLGILLPEALHKYFEMLQCFRITGNGRRGPIFDPLFRQILLYRFGKSNPLLRFFHRFFGAFHPAGNLAFGLAPHPGIHRLPGNLFPVGQGSRYPNRTGARALGALCELTDLGVVSAEYFEHRCPNFSTKTAQFFGLLAKVLILKEFGMGGWWDLYQISPYLFSKLLIRRSQEFHYFVGFVLSLYKFGTKPASLQPIYDRI